MIRVDVEWVNVDPHGDDDAMRWTVALYAIVEPSSGDIVYIGKADRSSVRARWRRCGAKADVWDWCERAYRSREHAFYVGELDSGATRLTRQLVEDVESLLIFRLQPSGNLQSKKSRIRRPGMLVVCSGDWPSKRRRFIDR